MAARLKDIISILDILDDTSKKIIKKSLEIINFIPTDYADEMLYRYPDFKRSKVINMLMDITTEWTSTAETIKTELPKLFEENDDKLSINFDNSQFFSELWSGDAYGKREIDALKMLENDLQIIFKKVSRSSLYNSFEKASKDKV